MGARGKGICKAGTYNSGGIWELGKVENSSQIILYHDGIYELGT
jgi:hypothetical protein